MIGYDVARALPDLQREALSLMPDVGVVTRGAATAPVFDPATGIMTSAVGVVVYQGPCRLRQPTPQESQALFGEAQVSISKFIAVLPHTVAGVRIGDVITLTSSADLDLLGVKFRVTAIPLSTYTIYKGYPVESVTT